MRLLIALWGERYIDVFCRICLPSLLAANNLPSLARAHDLEIVLLMRSDETQRITTYPVFHRLLGVAPVRFIDIDDLLARSFDPASDNYGMALTWAFFRCIRSYGAAALDIDFMLWNGDFAAADGTFATMAELISEGVRCTLATSLRVDSAIETALAAHLAADPTCLAVPPRELAALAMRHLHPTVTAKMVNRFEDRGISHPNQFYWQIDDRLILGRSFIWFPLQFRPEAIPEEIYGFCDYAFAPELVPSGDHHYETQSDRVLIIEVQHGEKAWEQVLELAQPMTPADVAPGLGYWTTREHVAASHELLVFNSGAPPDPKTARHQTDEFMNGIYGLLPQTPQWHNGHAYWRECHARAGLPYDAPGPDRAQSHLAAALRWTGHDLDLPRHVWRQAPDPLGTLLRTPPMPLSAGATGIWLDRLYSLCYEAWLADDNVEILGDAVIDLVAPGFYGFGWDAPRPSPQGWVRPLGPDGRAVLLLRVPPAGRVHLLLHGMCRGDTAPEVLTIVANGVTTLRDIEAHAPGPGFTVTVEIDAAAITLAGRLMIVLREPVPAAGAAASFAFASLTVATMDSAAAGVPVAEAAG